MALFKYALLAVLTLSLHLGQAANVCPSTASDVQLRGLGYIANLNSQTAGPNLASFLDAATAIKERTTETPPQLFFPVVANDKTDETKYAQKLGVCSLDPGLVVHYSTEAAKFLRCLSGAYLKRLVEGAEGQPQGACAASPDATTVEKQLQCLQEQALVPAIGLWTTSDSSVKTIKDCATDAKLDYDTLHKCATSAEGTQRLAVNQAACLSFLETQLLEKSGKGSSKGTGGLKTASSLLGGRRSGGARRFDLQDLDFFGHSHQPSPAQMEKMEATQMMGQAPLIAASDTGKHMNFGAQTPINAVEVERYTKFYEGWLCKAIQADEIDDSVSDRDAWAWVAGVAVGLSVLLAGGGVSVLHWEEKSWHKEGAFDRPGKEQTEGPNPFKFIQLTSSTYDGKLDLKYEQHVQIEPLKWLIGVKGSHNEENKAGNKLCKM